MVDAKYEGEWDYCECGNSEKQWFWECGKCGARYDDDEEQAQECCKELNRQQAEGEKK